MSKNKGHFFSRMLKSLFVVIIIGLGALWVASSYGIINWFGEEKREEVWYADSAMLARDSVMEVRLDSLVRDYPGLDTSIVAVMVYDATTRNVVFDHNANRPLIPASCMKIPTAIASLETLGFNYQFDSHIDTDGQVEGDALVGDLFVTTANDPSIESFDTLVQQIVDQGIHTIRGNVHFDLARKDTLKPHPHVPIKDLCGRRIPLLQGGEARIQNEFFKSMERCGIKYEGNDATVSDGSESLVEESTDEAGADSRHTLAQVLTPITDVVTPMLIWSNNAKAEAFFYHLDYQDGMCDSRMMDWDNDHVMPRFWRTRLEGGAEVMGEPSHKMSDIEIYDGSGLCNRNRLTASVLVDMLHYAWNSPRLQYYLISEGLPSPADTTRCGTLKGRMEEPRFYRHVFAKTGTLGSMGTTSLSGYIYGSDGHWYIFSIIVNKAPVAVSRAFQDAICSLFCEKVVPLYPLGASLAAEGTKVE